MRWTGILSFFYCLHPTPTQYPLCVKRSIDPLSFPPLFDVVCYQGVYLGWREAGPQGLWTLLRLQLRSGTRRFKDSGKCRLYIWSFLMALVVFARNCRSCLLVFVSLFTRNLTYSFSSHSPFRLNKTWFIKEMYRPAASEPLVWY